MNSENKTHRPGALQAVLPSESIDSMLSLYTDVMVTIHFAITCPIFTFYVLQIYCLSFAMPKPI